MVTLPRRFRPHCIKLLLKLPDNDDGKLQERIVYIDHIKVDATYGVQQSKKGISTEDKIAIYIELSDYTAYDDEDMIQEYIPKFKYEQLADRSNYFTIIAGQDMIDFHDESFLITSANEIMFTSDKPIRLELLAK